MLFSKNIGEMMPADVTSEFPLLRSLSYRAVLEAVPQFKLMHEIVSPIVTLISKYVASKLTVDTPSTMRLLDFHTPEWVKSLQRNVNAIIEKSDNGQRVPNGAMKIKPSLERELITLAESYFSCLGAGQPFKETDDSAFNEFLLRIEGVSLIHRCDFKTDPRRCHDYVLGHLSWHQAEFSRLLSQPEEVVKFLLSKKFTRVVKKNDIKTGQLIIYHTGNLTYHFAKVCRLIEEGSIIAISKLAKYHIVEHKLGCLPPDWGHSVTFMNYPIE